MSLAIAAAGTTLALFLAYKMFFTKSHFQPKDKHVYIGGGSQGLGLSLACLMAEKGAHVTIVSRTQKKLDEALKEVEVHAPHLPSQILTAISADLSSCTGASKALDQASAAHDGRCPDVVVSCTGGAGGILGYFVELTEEQLVQGVQTNYWTAAWTAHAAAKKMAKQRISGGKIVLTSSVIVFLALPGYSAYAPSKHAIRGLADTLRSELSLYSISVHAYFPATIYSPGYEEEEKCKPKLTKEIEGADEGLKPEECAKRLVRGLERGEFLITSDPIGHLFKNSMRGMSPMGNHLLDPLFGFVATIAVPIWRRITDHQIKGHRKEHEAEVVDKL